MVFTYVGNVRDKEWSWAKNLTLKTQTQGLRFVNKDRKRERTRDRKRKKKSQEIELEKYCRLNGKEDERGEIFLELKNQKINIRRPV